MLKLRDIDHVVLRVRDIEAMARFYCDVLGARHVAYRPELGTTHLRVKFNNGNNGNNGAGFTFPTFPKKRTRPHLLATEVGR